MTVLTTVEVVPECSIRFALHSFVCRICLEGSRPRREGATGGRCVSHNGIFTSRAVIDYHRLA